ncbi:uncharacterized protein METZ01_LOCUS112081 [marine metagenome]|uniref:Uncharacterized protein n=1 Tax=marine metagenome TaxID=408172 RepID=A0A381X4U6_9ZZZZ
MGKMLRSNLFSYKNHSFALNLADYHEPSRTSS